MLPYKWATASAVLQLLSPSTNILISPRFLDDALRGFLEIANPEWWISSYRQHKVVISQREPEISRVMGRAGFPEHSTRIDQSTRLHGGMRAGAKAAASCVGDVISPSPPCWLQYATEAKSEQRGVCSNAILCANWSRKKRIPELQRKPFALTFWHNRCQSLPRSHNNFCISKVCSWDGVFFVI